MVCVPREDRSGVANQFVSNSRFAQTDEGDQLRGYLVGWLLDGVATTAIDQLQRQYNWLQQGRLLVGEGDQMEIRQVTADEWTQLADGLMARLEMEADEEQRQKIATLLDSVHASYVSDRRLPFVRRMLTEAAEQYRSSWRSSLFSLLQQQPWTEEIEAEAFALWPEIVDIPEEPVELVSWRQVQGLVPVLYQLVDAMLRNRVAAAQRALQDDGHTDELTRTELADKQKEFVKSAQEGLATRIDQLLAERDFDDDPLVPWLQLERAWFDIRLDRNRDNVLETCWGILGRGAPRVRSD